MGRIEMLWPEGRRKALTFSYDDGVVQDRRLIALMRKHGIRGTFNLNSGFLGWRDSLIRDGKEVDHSHISAEEISELYEGMEIAVHTVTHPDLTALSEPEILEEIIKDREALEKLAGYPIHGMAYPFGTTDVRICRILRSCGIRWSRGVSVTNGYSLPADPYDWACSCHHYDLEPLIGPFLEKTDRPPRGSVDLMLLSVWGHSYEFDQKEEWEKIEDQMARLGGQEDVWYATNGEVFDYIAAYRALDQTLDGRIVYNPTAKKIWIRAEARDVCIAPGEVLHLLETDFTGEHPYRIWKNA